MRLHTRNFQIINQVRPLRPLRPLRPMRPMLPLRPMRGTVPVHDPFLWQVGAVSLRATLNCEEFASNHRATSHFDRSSFVGLAWRPANESICCGALQIDPCPFPHVYRRRFVPCAVRRGVQHRKGKVRRASNRLPVLLYTHTARRAQPSR